LHASYADSSKMTGQHNEKLLLGHLVAWQVLGRRLSTVWSKADQVGLSPANRFTVVSFLRTPRQWAESGAP